MPAEMVKNQAPPAVAYTPVVAPVQGNAPAAAAKPSEQPAEVPAQAEAAPKQVSTEELRKVVAEVAQIVRRDLNFSIDEDSGRTVVKVIDSESNEVVRQIPSEEMLALARHLTQMANERMVSGEQAKGLLMTVKV